MNSIPRYRLLVVYELFGETVLAVWYHDPHEQNRWTRWPLARASAREIDYDVVWRDDGAADFVHGATRVRVGHAQTRIVEADRHHRFLIEWAVRPRRFRDWTCHQRRRRARAPKWIAPVVGVLVAAILTPISKALDAEPAEMHDPLYTDEGKVDCRWADFDVKPEPCRPPPGPIRCDALSQRDCLEIIWFDFDLDREMLEFRDECDLGGDFGHLGFGTRPLGSSARSPPRLGL